jgi:glycosyltransferase involved in cell wall biosynthesis
MRLVIVTQKVDTDDPILGATVAKLKALAGVCENVHVLALSVGRHDLPANVTFATFGAPTRLRRGLRYLRVLLPALLPRPPDALLAHMCPIYLVLAAPLAKPLRVPLLIWYTHWTIDRTLKLATRLCDAALSVDRRSYPLDSPKVIALGHGIDVEEFPARDGYVPASGRLSLLALGRTSPSKGFPTLLDALERAAGRGLDFELELRGPSTTDEERGHREELRVRIESGPLRDRVRLEPPLPRPEVPALLRRFDAVVNPTRGQTHGGALDKVVFESAASAVPVLACNPHFEGFLGDLPVELRFRSADPDDLADKLVAFAAAPAEAQLETGRELRRRVEASHSSLNWAQGVVRVVEGLRGR